MFKKVSTIDLFYLIAFGCVLGFLYFSLISVA